jgi:glycosyltransferase involved in cell wall biosynthesis
VYAAWASHLRFGTPYVVTRRVLNPLSRTAFAARAYGSATSLVGVSNAVCDLIERETGRPATRILDAHRELKPNSNEVERIRGQIAGGPIIGQVAALKMDRKGQHHLIAAFRQIKIRFPDARLLLLGTGPDEAELRRQAEAVGGVLFAGQQSNIADWTAALDLVAYPSKMDALASSLLDAMHLGIPIVANRVGGIPEIAEHGVSALLVDYGDIDGLAAAAIRLLENPSLRQRQVQAAQAFVAHLGPVAMAAEYLRIYCEAERQWTRREQTAA